MKKGLIALAFGTLVLGLTEFVMMGILPDVANGLKCSIVEAGYLISAYALGVCLGAPMLTVVHKYAPKNILLALGTMMLVGGILCTIAPNFETMLVARFIAGLPHGAYFGVASIVAVKIADENHKTGAVAVMIAGMTIANLLAVPLGTWLSANVSWRMPFVLVIALSLLVVYYTWRWVPQVEALPDHGFRHQFAFLKSPMPWFILSATTFANGGIFCWYSYVTPIMTMESGFLESVMPVLMIASGVGMVMGNIVSGKLSDRFSPSKVALNVQFLAVIALLATFFFADVPYVTAPAMVVTTACLFGVSSPQQFLILKHAPGGEMLGGAAIQMAFNLGNAIGAYAGGLPASAGLPYSYAALVGAPMVMMGVISFAIFRKKEKVSN